MVFLKTRPAPMRGYGGCHWGGEAFDYIALRTGWSHGNSVQHRQNGVKIISDGCLRRAALHPNASLFYLQGACGVACGRWDARHGEHLGRSEKEKSRGLRQAQPRLVRVNASRGSIFCSSLALHSGKFVRVKLRNRILLCLEASIVVSPVIQNPPIRNRNLHKSIKARYGIPLTGYIWI